MDTLSNLGISKAASFRSMRRSSIQPPSSHHPSEGRKSVAHTASSRAALLQAINNNNNNTDFDRASETSSMEERRYAELLGPDRDFDPFPEFGEVHEPKNVGHRLYICGVAQQKAREEKLRARRERIILRELNELTTKPSITNHARLKPSKGSMFADHSEEWQQRKMERLAETAEKVRMEREKELTASPSINRKSALIAESSGYRGPIEGWEDHFAKYYAKKSCASLQAPPPGMFTPNVNHSYRNSRLNSSAGSGTLNASSNAADVSARLYEDAIVREEKQAALRERLEEELTKDPFTNRPYFTPSRVEYPLQRPDMTPEEAGARLHNLHEEKERKRLERMQQLDKVVEESKFKPALDPRSVEIGDRRRRPLYEKKDVSETLHSTRRDNSRGPSQNHSTTSTTNNSQKISSARVDEFLKRTERNNAMRQQRLERIRSEAHDRQTGECTFKPAVNRRSMELFYEINQYGADLDEFTSHRRKGAAASSAAFTNNNTNDGSSMGAVSTPRAGGGGGGRGSTPSASPITTGRKSRYGGDQYPQHGSGPQQYNHRDPMQGVEGYDEYPQQQQRHGRGASGSPYNNNQQHQQNDGGNANEYAKQFEAQMFQVLDEWRRLEDV